MSKLIEQMLVAEEGEVLHAYEDHLGYTTIGVGRLIDHTKGGGITKEESRYLLAHDIEKAVAKAREYPWFDSLSEPRKAVVVGMIFQLGAYGFSKFKNTIARIAAGDYAAAADGMKLSRWAEQTPARVARMSSIMAGGEWPYT